MYEYASLYVLFQIHLSLSTDEHDAWYEDHIIDGAPIYYFNSMLSTISVQQSFDVGYSRMLCTIKYSAFS